MVFLALQYSLTTNLVTMLTSTNFVILGSFNIGVSLHACGVATDLVIQKCIENTASFVSCPCCYGSVQENHMVNYPRSKEFKEVPIDFKVIIFVLKYYIY